MYDNRVINKFIRSEYKKIKRVNLDSVNDLFTTLKNTIRDKYIISLESGNTIILRGNDDSKVSIDDVINMIHDIFDDVSEIDHRFILRIRKIDGEIVIMKRI